MGDEDATARRAQEVTIERWEYDYPSWAVVAYHPVITTSDGTPVEEIVVITGNPGKG
jgi:hypothetical protein